MVNKKNIIIHLVSVSILCAGFALCRYTFLEIHGMKQLPGLLFGVGMVFLAISFFLRGKVAPIVIALTYLIGFVAGVVFETDGVDAGSGATSNLWIIWTVVFVSLSVISGISEKMFNNRKNVISEPKMDNRSREEFDKSKH